MKYPLPFFKRRTKKPTSPPGLSPSLQSPGRSKKRVGQLSVLSVWERVCVSAYGRPFSCRTALFLFSPPLSSVESVDLGVLSSPLLSLASCASFHSSRPPLCQSCVAAATLPDASDGRRR